MAIFKSKDPGWAFASLPWESMTRAALSSSPQRTFQSFGGALKGRCPFKLTALGGHIMVGSIVLLVMVLCSLSIIWTTYRVGISPMPTSKQVQRDLLPLLPQLDRGKIFELGSGFGHLALLLSGHYPARAVFAYELSYVPYIISLCWKVVVRRKNLWIARKDFFEVSLQDASFVVCYLYPKAMERLKEKLLRELLPGSYVLSHTFAFRGWKPLMMLEAKDLGKNRIYLYRM